MPNTLEERDWEVLLPRIQDGKCTPFLGAGVNHGILPTGSEIAQQWAKKYGYPLEDSSDLVRVAQFVAVNKGDAMFPKEEILKLLKKALDDWLKRQGLKDISFASPDEPLSVLAKLPFPIYMTSNYDDLLTRLLKSSNKDPRRELCRWNRYVADKPSAFDSPSGFEPTTLNPVVFHLHGHDEVPESLVLTEDDYLDFLVNVSRQQDLLPSRIHKALAGTSLLFIGYRLADWDFRVLFRGLVNSMEATLRRISVAVQLPPACDPREQEHVQAYLADYLGNINVKVFWGTAQEFAAELRDRWTAFGKRPSGAGRDATHA